MQKFLVTFVILLGCLMTHPALAADDMKNPPACALENLDIAAQIGGGAHPQQNLTFDFRNKGSQACVLHAAQLATETGRQPNLCGHDKSEADCSTPVSFMLQPGKAAHTVFTWNTRKIGEDGQCSDVSRLSAYMFDPAAGRSSHDDDDPPDDRSAGTEPFYSLHISETTNFRIRLCSAPASGPYLDGPSGIIPAVDAETDMHIALSKDYDTYYLDDPVKLHLDIDHPSLGLSSGLEGDVIQDMCWQLIVMQQTKKADGTLRVELSNMANNPAYPVTCGLAPDGHLKMEKEVRDGYSDEDNPPLLSDETVSYSIVRGDNRLWRDIAATSNSLSIHYADPATLPHPWGHQADGFAVSLTLDKDRFDMGTALRAHLACTRFGKDWKQKGYVEKVDPVCRIDTVLTDSNGNPITKRFDHWEPDLGNGSDKKVDRSFKAGQTLYREQILAPGGSFVYGNTPMPKLVPGTYYLTSFWDAEDDSISPPLRTVAKSLPVKIEISGGP